MKKIPREKGKGEEVKLRKRVTKKEGSWEEVAEGGNGGLLQNFGGMEKAKNSQENKTSVSCTRC